MVVDDDDATCELVSAVLERAGMKPLTFTRGADALEAAQQNPPVVLLTDLEMQEMDGLDLMKSMRSNHPDLPVIVITGHADLDHAIGALRAGAYDFLTKPLDLKRLIPTIERAAEHHTLRAEVRRLRHRVGETKAYASMVGTSPPMKRVFELVSRVAPTDASVLITGESGTGKELVARAMHEESSRAEGPFVAVNCAAVPANLIESELFGHMRGAFTDARQDRRGLFSEADGGTLFLDEVGELPLEVQPKLLRALQERKVRPVGGDQEIPFDARVVAATNRNLRGDVEAGRFREDLYYRINVVGIEIPPLRDRGMDILALAQHFVERIADRFGKDVAGIGPDTARRLLAYPWPGNVRELENCVGRAVALTRYDKLTVSDLPDTVRSHRPERVPVEADDPEELLTLSELEARYLRRVLRVVEGNKSKAARVLGIDRRTLYRKLARLEEDAT
jgi:two-component system response regulator HydG